MVWNFAGCFRIDHAADDNCHGQLLSVLSESLRMLYCTQCGRNSRYTINTVVGSVSGAVPLIGWTAVEGNIGVVAWVLFMILFIWQIPHFLALAIKKTEDYRAANIPMLPVVYGFEVTKRQIIVWVACLMPPVFPW